MQVRSAGDAAKKFRERASAARGDYASGVANAGGKWQAGAAAAGDAYREGVSAALAEDRFTKGVNRGNAASKYQNNATKLGPDRFATGVQNAEGAYSQGVQPFIAAMQGTNLSPRGSRASGANIRRVSEVVDLMRKVKREQLGVTG